MSERQRPGLLLVLVLIADLPLFWGLAELFAGPLVLSAEQIDKGVPWVLMVAGAMLQAPFAHIAMQSRKEPSNKAQGERRKE